MVENESTNTNTNGMLLLNQFKEQNLHKIIFQWGIDEISLQNKWNSLESGEIVWDETFDVSSVQSQNELLDFCDSMIEYLEELEVSQYELNCWVKEFEQFIEE